MKNEKNHIVGTVPKSNRKIVERDKIDTPNPQIHQHFSLLSWLGTGTSIKSGRLYWFDGSKPQNCSWMHPITINSIQH